jgi:tetratricopeptide (TPR) repeat protein
MSHPERTFIKDSYSLWRVTLICVALFLMVFMVFGRTVHHGFVNYDDDTRVYNNPLVLQGLTWKGISTYFSLHHPRPDYFHPITFLSHMMDCQFYGPWAGGHHLTNVLLHAVMAGLLFLLLRSMTGAMWRSALVAALFAIHPLRVESVAWIAERKDMLSGIFFLLTIGAYLRYGRNPSLTRYLAVVLLFAFGLMAKPTLMPLPLLLLALDYWPLERHRCRGKQVVLCGLPVSIVLEKLPLLAMSLFSVVEASIANAEAFTDASAIPRLLRLENVSCSYLFYLWKEIWPSGLCIYYPFPESGIPIWQAVTSTLVLLAISWSVFFLRHRQPLLLIGWIWYLVMLLPMVGIIQAGGIAHADRYTYIPMIGIAIMIVWGASDWIQSHRIPRFVVGGGVALLLITLMMATFQQTAYWQDTVSLWTRELDCFPENDQAHNSCGNGLLDQGNIAGAIREFHRALVINPGSSYAHASLGYALFLHGELDEAITEDREAIRLNPTSFTAYNNLGNALAQKGKAEEAEAEYSNALKIHPMDSSIHFNMGNLFLIQGKYEQAFAEFRETIKLNPSHVKARYQLGKNLYVHGNRADGMMELQKSIFIEPSNEGIRNDLAWMLATAPEESLRNGPRSLEFALDVNKATGGKNPFFLDTLAAAYAENGNFIEALQVAQHALDLAQSAGIKELVKNLREEINHYEASEPIKDP